MRLALAALWLVLAAGCKSAKPQEPNPTPAPASVNLEAVGVGLDQIDSKVAASVAVAREANKAGAPHKVEAELGVAAASLPPAQPGDLAIARLRADKASPEEYKSHMKAAEAKQKELEAAWVTLDSQAKANKAAMTAKDKKIEDLNRQIETIKKEASRDIFTLTGAFLVVAGGLACAFASIRIGIPILLAGFFAAAVPHIIDTEWFGWLAGATLLACAGLLVFWLFDKVRDNVNENKPQEKNDAPKEEDQN
jgi:hypothetical protein